MDNLSIDASLFPALLDKKLWDKGWHLLWGEITDETCEFASSFLLEALLYQKKEVTIFLCSEGGTEDDARALLSIIELCKSSGMIVRVYGAGVIASAAFDIFAACSPGYRFCFETTMFMTHATAGHVEDEAMFDLQKRFNIWTLKKYTNIHPATIKKFMKTGNWWFDPSEAVGYGVADAIVNAGDKLPSGPIIPVRKSAEEQKKTAAKIELEPEEE